MSDEDARKVFEQQRDRLGTPEKREVSQIVFPNAEEALAARGRLTSGTSFDDLAKERNLNLADVDLGLITKSAILDPAVADAAFSHAVRRSQPAGAGPLRRGTGQGRQDRARNDADL